jgi:trk system potassium uptake protein TrkH
LRIRAIQRITGILLFYFSLSMLPPAAIAWAMGERTLFVFLATFAVVMVASLVLWIPARGQQAEFRLRDGFFTAVVLWVVLSTVGAVPFLYAPGLSTVDAIFESVSGLTTTGASVMQGLDRLPLSVLYYRQQLEWLGGMGVIIFAVAVLPILGVGGMEIYRVQTPGPMKYHKLTPRIAQTARTLWFLYTALTVACAVAYWVAGMSLFDAISVGMSTVSLGAFTPHDGSFSFFDNAAVEIVASIFMVLSGANFALHFTAWREMSIRPYRDNAELRTYLYLLAVLSAITVGYLYLGGAEGLGRAVVQGVFQTLSMATTAGYTTGDYYHWPAFVAVMLLMAGFIGGCAGSTGGGIKVMRALLLVKQGNREVKRLIHPGAYFPIKIDGRTLESDTIEAVWGFFSLYVASFVVITMILSMTGLDLVTSFSTVAACINNVGPALGKAAGSYAGLGAASKWILCLAMLVGRLEVFTLLVLFVPGFWTK